MKGSQKAILELIEASNHLDLINKLIQSTGANITTNDAWKPKGIKAKEEGTLTTFLKKTRNSIERHNSSLHPPINYGNSLEFLLPKNTYTTGRGKCISQAHLPVPHKRAEHRIHRNIPSPSCFTYHFSGRL